MRSVADFLSTTVALAVAFCVKAEQVGGAFPDKVQPAVTLKAQEREAAIGKQALIDLGRALANYLHRGRPSVAQKQIFLRHHFHCRTPLGTRQIRYAIQKAYARAGLPVTRIHLLRHSFATNLHQQGVSVKALADLLGHKSLESTTLYTRVNLRQLRLVAMAWPRSTP